MKKAELLSPGGSLRKIKTALLYGADAIYAGTPDMSLRTKSELSLEDLIEVSKITKKNNKKLYLTLNLFSHNRDMEKLPKFVETIKIIQPDGLLIADPGIFAYFRKHLPDVKLHISTQANVCSSLSVNFWKSQGASLVVLAREVSFEEMKEIKEQCTDIKIEAFVHGSMCMTYSGRCLLSNFMAERGANQGSCAHSCRWNYKVRIKLKDNKLFELNLNEETKEFFDFYLEEEFREGEYFRIEEDEMGSYILNSKDLCLMPVLDDYLKIGVDTLKIEGRNKGEYYAGITARAYRYAIDSYYKDPQNWDSKPYMDELDSVASRGYTMAFHTGRLSNLAHSYNNSKTLSDYMFCGIVMSYDEEYMYMELKNYLKAGEVLEFISPFVLEPIRLRLYEFLDATKNIVKDKISPGSADQQIRIPLKLFNNISIDELKELLPPLSLVRKETPASKFDTFIKENDVSFKVENSKATQDLLDKVKAQSVNQLLNEEEKKVNYKSPEESCCSKGCNGCLPFWFDDKYKNLRDKLKDKKLGEKLIKQIDF